MKRFFSFLPIVAMGFCVHAYASDIRVNGAPGQLDICVAGQNAIRVTLKPQSFSEPFPFTPAIADTESTWKTLETQIAVGLNYSIQMIIMDIPCDN